MSLSARCACALMLLLTACGPSAECRESCSRIGVEPESEACRTLCTSDCEELAQAYGSTVETCEQMQRGER